MATTIDSIGKDLLRNIVTRLPATSFASAACVNRSWTVVCNRVLCRPKLSSACSTDPSLETAVEEVVNRVLSEPIRPHFAIASFGPEFDLDNGHELITTKLGSQVPVITIDGSGILARDALSDEFKEIQWTDYDVNDDPDAPEDLSARAVMLIVGFLPGLKVKIIPLLKRTDVEKDVIMIGKFVKDVTEFSISSSGSESPAAVIVHGVESEECMTAVIEKMDNVMSPETVIVGDNFSRVRCTKDDFPAVALVFAVDRNKPLGVGKTQFHAVLSSGLSPVGSTYKVTSAFDTYYKSWIAARREGSLENLNGETILNNILDELVDGIQSLDFYVGVTKERKCSIGQEKVGCMSSFAFHKVCGSYGNYIYVTGDGIKTGDTFRFYNPDFKVALSSAADVSSHMKSLNNTTAGGDKQEVFGGLIFTGCGEQLFSQPNVDSSLFLNNFPGVTLGGIFCCNNVIGRHVLTRMSKNLKCDVAYIRTVLSI